MAEPSTYGTWVHYPWSGRLVRVLPSSEFEELRTSRNRNKITREEQTRLGALRVGIAGLSVGQSTAVTLALEGIGGVFRLADFDTLSLSNMNRLRAGVHEIGVNKAVLVAREIYEINPYAVVEVFLRGVRDDSIDAFFSKSAPLNLLFEECDDLKMKFPASRGGAKPSHSGPDGNEQSRAVRRGALQSRARAPTLSFHGRRREPGAPREHDHLRKGPHRLGHHRRKDHVAADGGIARGYRRDDQDLAAAGFGRCPRRRHQRRCRAAHRARHIRPVGPVLRRHRVHRVGRHGQSGPHRNARGSRFLPSPQSGRRP